MVKRLISLSLVSILVLGLCGCGNTDNSSSQEVEVIYEYEEEYESQVESTVDNSSANNAQSETTSVDNTSKNESVASTSSNTSVDDETEEVIFDKQEWNEDGYLKVLIIGNSYGLNAGKYLYNIAKDVGVQQVYVGALYIGSCSLEQHLSNAKSNKSAYEYYINDLTWDQPAYKSFTMKDAVKAENWDYIIFQQNSENCGNASSYDDLQPLIDIVEPNCPNAKLLWYMIWPYHPDVAAGSGGEKHKAIFQTFNNDQMTMYNAIVSATKTKIVTNKKIDSVIPVGTAIQNARTSYLGQSFNNTDGYHLSNLGCYIAGLTFAKAMTGYSLDINSAYVPLADGISKEQKVIAIESANNAISSPFTVTQSQYVN